MSQGVCFIISLRCVCRYIYHLGLEMLAASGVEMDRFLDSTFRSMKSRVVSKIKKIQIHG